MRLLILCVLTASMTLAQETRETRTNPSPNPADDAKANSASVPDVYAITGHFDRIVVLRFKYQTRLEELTLYGTAAVAILYSAVEP